MLADNYFTFHSAINLYKKISFKIGENSWRDVNEL